jgi:MFS family permease
VAARVLVKQERMEQSAPTRPASLWRNRSFTAFWVGQTVSQFGTQVTFVALPLAAVLTLQVSAGQLGLLRFAEDLPYLLFTLAFGVWADRRRRRRLMLATYVLRGALVGLVPLLAFLGLLRFSLLTMIAFCVGVGAALFEVCWLSYVPSLVESNRLVEAMSKVATSNSSAEVAGPALGGVLVQLLTAPYALLLDALSYVVGVISLLSVRVREPKPKPPRGTPRQIVAELVEGPRFAFTERHIRALAFMAAIANLFALITETVFLFYAVRGLGLSPSVIGFVLTTIGAGGLFGAAVSNAIIKRWPLGRVFLWARVIGGLGALLLPLAVGPQAVIVAICMASFFLVQAAFAISNIVSSSLRQVLTPERIRGRMNASIRTLVFGALPLGGLAAGLLTETLGARPALWLGATGYVASIIPVLASPIPGLRNLPTPESEET